MLWGQPVCLVDSLLPGNSHRGFPTVPFCGIHTVWVCMGGRTETRVGRSGQAERVGAFVRGVQTERVGSPGQAERVGPFVRGVQT